jgi:hypothetical protein
MALILFLHLVFPILGDIAASGIDTAQWCGRTATVNARNDRATKLPRLGHLFSKTRPRSESVH